MKKLLIALIIVLLCLDAFASEDWKTIHFTNRAQCARESNKPSTTAFVLINNMDIARSLYRLAKSRQIESTPFTIKGIKQFRQTVLSLLQIIHLRLISGELPLLPSDLREENVSNNYKRIMENCRSDEGCLELDAYIEQLWNQSGNDGLKIINKFIYRKKNRSKKLDCRFLKKLSPLHADLFFNKPTKEVLLSIGKAHANYQDFYGSCDNHEIDQNLKVANYEIALNIDHHFFWDKEGFDYWNSLKIYFSWAYRHSLEMDSLSQAFSSLFRSLEIEDSVMIVPNNCKSIVKPQCESSFLNQSVLREFAKKEYANMPLSFDHLSPLPEGSTKDLMSNPFPEVNRDILGTNQYDTFDAWADQFRENFSNARTLMRQKLSTALTKLQIITAQISPSELAILISKDFIAKDFSLTTPSENQFKKNSLYYLCAEFGYAHDSEYGVLKEKIDLLKNSHLLDQIISSQLPVSLPIFYNYYQELAIALTQTCKNLDQKQFFLPPFVHDPSGFNDWYLSKTRDPKIKSTVNLKKIESLTYNSPLLSFASSKESKDIQDAICVNAIDCSREVLRSIIDLYSATIYAETFWNIDRQIKSPQIFNPYAERTACKIYDPWFKTKSTLVSFMSSVAQAGLSLSYPGLIYAKVDLEPRRVVSFNQLVKEGKILYNPKSDHQKIKTGLALNLGKWLNVPCGISISQSEKTNPFNYLQFQGISLRACQKNESHTIEVKNDRDQMGSPKESHQCLVCSLNFETVVSLSKRSIPMASPVYLLARSLFGLYKGLSDSVNIPHSFSVDPEMVANTMERFKGDIPKECVYPLSHARECTQ